VLTGGPTQLLLTAASMLACINAIVGGVTVALAVRWLDVSVPVAAAGVVAALGFATLFVVSSPRSTASWAAPAWRCWPGGSVT
jgi:hypothetical protein